MALLCSNANFGVTAPEGLTIFIDYEMNDLGVVSPEVSAEARQLCGLMFPGETLEAGFFMDIARERYARLRRADSTGHAALALVAYVSSYYHELRHVHDLIATTYGQDVLFQSLNCSQNFGALLNSLESWQTKNPGRPIPFPLGRVPDLLTELSDDAAEVVRRYLKGRAEVKLFEAPSRASPARLTVSHLLEASAINIQLGFIREVFGENVFLDFERFIRGGARAALYLQIRSDAAERFGVTGSGAWELDAPIGFLLWCSLLGTTFPGEKYAEGPTSVILFEALLEHVSRNLASLDLPTVRAAVEAFYTRWGLLPPSEMIARRSGELAARAERFRAAWSAQRPLDDQDFGRFYTSLAEAFAVIASLVEGDPYAYFDARGYVNAYVDRRLPSVLVTCRTGGTSHDFITRGREVVSAPHWNTVSCCAMVFSMLVNGRGQYPSFVEDLCWRLLTEPRRNGTKLRFQDRSAIFDW